jgi:hypothetical protein
MSKAVASTVCVLGDQSAIRVVSTQEVSGLERCVCMQLLLTGRPTGLDLCRLVVDGGLMGVPSRWLSGAGLNEQ